MSVGEAIVRGAWRDEGLRGRAWRTALGPAAAAYSAGVRLRALAYRLRLRRGERLPAAVVSVGNLTVGGTGKTPAALWVAEGLRSRGRRVAILSRGYGGSARKATIVAPPGSAGDLPASEDWRVVGDENVLLARRFRGPVVVGRRRPEAGSLACAAFGCDALVLDDGFQHLALARDFDLLCVRAGSTRRAALLPAGPFREPLSAIRRAHAVLFTKGGAGTPPDSALVARLDGRPLFRGELRPLGVVTPDGSGAWRELPLGHVAGRRAVVVTGVAERDPFYRTLHDWELQVEDFLEFPDHHAYGPEDWKTISSRARDTDLVVTTEKDLVKLERFPFARDKLVAVRVVMEVEEGEQLMEQILQAISASGTGGAS